MYYSKASWLTAVDKLVRGCHVGWCGSGTAPSGIEEPPPPNAAFEQSCSNGAGLRRKSGLLVQLKPPVGQGGQVILNRDW